MSEANSVDVAEALRALAQGVADAWPETKRRLLQDQRAARLADLASRARRPTLH
jgi:hypothetical protein